MYISFFFVFLGGEYQLTELNHHLLAKSVLLCFSKPRLGNRYVPGGSSRASQGARTTYILTLSPLRQPGVAGSSRLNHPKNKKAEKEGPIKPEGPSLPSTSTASLDLPILSSSSSTGFLVFISFFLGWRTSHPT